MDEFLQHTIQELIDFRRRLHQLAERSGQEKNTAEYVSEILKTLNPAQLHTNIGGNGIVAIFGKRGPLILFRAELDALPIEDSINTDYVSHTVGVGHKCGHDGHMAALLGLGKWLSLQNLKNEARIGLLFQPAEETGEGAAKIIESGLLESIQPSAMLAFHNLPGYPKHKVLLKEGVFAKASTGMIISLKGKTSHAAHPEDGISPVKAVIELLSYLEHVQADRKRLDDGSLLTIVHARIGEVAFGTSPGEAVVMATVRAENTAVMDEIVTQVKAHVNEIAQANLLKVNVTETERFETTDNNPDLTTLVAQSATDLGLEVPPLDSPFGWSEDFGRFTRIMPGAMFGIGSGNNHPQLHHPDYDFPDEIIPTVVSIYIKCCQLWMESANASIPIKEKT